MDVAPRLAQDPEADALLGRSPLAALVGMVLDQQIPVEWAFKGPALPLSLSTVTTAPPWPSGPSGRRG